MFERFKKSNDIYSPIKGVCRDITECEDVVFAKKMMGDGFFIEPASQVVVSPCDGKIKAVFPTKHAVGIEMADGKEVMVHIGLDTVKLNGKGFQTSLQVGNRVKHGDTLVEFDMAYIKECNISIPVIVVLVNDFTEHDKMCLNEMVATDTVIIKR